MPGRPGAAGAGGGQAAQGGHQAGPRAQPHGPSRLPTHAHQILPGAQAGHRVGYIYSGSG